VLLLLPFAVGGCGETPPSDRVVQEARGVALEVTTTEALESGMPTFARFGGTTLLSHLERRTDTEWALVVSEVSSTGEVTDRRTVHRGENLFVNWADVPSVTPFGADGRRRVAHWLERGATGGYDYGIRVAVSDDGGRTWGEAWTPHGDGTPTEHGFVAVLPSADGFDLLWLDGRRYAEGDERMQLRGRSWRGAPGAEPDRGAEEVVDPLVCDCCPTAVAATPGGAVAVYRDRTVDEIRDIHAAAWERPRGGWRTLGAVHDDGWEIAGCPVNGPAVASGPGRTVVAWFTAAGDEPRVLVAFGGPEGGDFGPPVRVDHGLPVGRVDVQIGASGEALVTWIETSASDGGAELLLVVVAPDGSASPSRRLAEVDAARASGFPRLLTLDDGDLLVAWTEVRPEGRRLRVERVEGVGP